MCSLTTEKRNRESKKLFFYSTFHWPVSLYYKCIIYSSSSLSDFSLFISCTSTFWKAIFVLSGFCDACTVWSLCLTCFCQLLFTNTHFIQCVHIYTPTVQGHRFPASKPTHLGRLGGGAFEYTVVVWPRAPAWLDCRHVCFCSSGQSASQCCKRAGYAAFLYLQTAAKEQLYKHIYIKPALY